MTAKNRDENGRHFSYVESFRLINNGYANVYIKMLLANWFKVMDLRVHFKL